MSSSSLAVHGITYVATLEAIACRVALSLADDLQLSNFIVASNSNQVIGDIQQGNKGGYGTIISEIKKRAVMFNCTFTFEGRASNIDVDRLAKILNSLDQGRHVWLMQPHDPFCIPLHIEFE